MGSYFICVSRCGFRCVSLVKRSLFFWFYGYLFSFEMNLDFRGRGRLLRVFLRV